MLFTKRDFLGATWRLLASNKMWMQTIKRPRGVVLDVFERTLIYDADESRLDFGPPNNAGTYTCFPGWAIAGNGDYVAAYRRNTQHGLRLGFGALQVNISGSQGRSWMQKRDDITVTLSGAYDAPTQEQTRIAFDPYSPAITRLPDNSLYLTWENDYGTQAQNRLVFGSRSTDNGRTWGAQVQFPWFSNWLYTSAGGKVLSLGGNTLIAPHYHRDFVSGTSGAVEGRYTSEIFRSDDLGASWYLYSTLARDASAGGLQYEEPQIIRLDDGRIFALIRSDTDETIYGSYSSDGGLTWTYRHSCFPGHGWPALVQCTSGIIVAMTRTPTASEQSGAPAVWASLDRGLTWLPMGLIGENIPAAGSPFGLAPYGAYMYGDMQEISPNVIGIISGQDQSTVTRSRLWFMKMAVNQLAPSVPYHRPRTIDTDEQGNRGYNFGTSTLLNGATSFFVEGWLRFRRRQQTGIILRHGNSSNSQQQIDLRYLNTGGSGLDIGHLELTIAGSLTTFNRAVTPNGIIKDDEWMWWGWLFNGAGTTDAERCRFWCEQRNVVAPTELALTFTGGAMPAQLTSPSSATWTLGCNETAAAGTGWNGLLSELRIWESPVVTTVLASINTLFNQRVPLDPASSPLGTPAAWIAVDSAGVVRDLIGRLPAPAALGSTAPTVNTFFHPAHGYLSLGGTYAGGL